MGGGKDQGAQPLHPAVVPEPGHLLGQQDGEGQLHHLGRLDLHREVGDGQPGLVARSLTAHAEFPQQGDEAQVEDEKQPPLLREVLHIHVGEDEIGPDAHDRAGGLDDHPAQLVGRPPVGRGAGDEHNAEGRTDQTQPQQDHVRLFYNVFHGRQQPVEDGHSSAS